MKKLGFTLVELLAVIAILAILVIIALPNVMGMFNQAKENSFMTELKQIHQVAQQKWISDSMFSTGEKEYARCSTETCPNQLDLSGRTELEYYIKINQAGKIVKYYATDGTYQYSYEGDGLLPTDIIKVDHIADIGEDNKIKITCGGGSDPNTRIVYYNEMHYGQQLNYTEAIPSDLPTSSSESSVSNKPAFLKIVLNGNNIRELYVGFVYNGNVYYLQGGPGSNYEQNKALLSSIFDVSKCEISDNFMGCRDGEFYAGIDKGTHNVVNSFAGAGLENGISCGIDELNQIYFCFENGT